VTERDGGAGERKRERQGGDDGQRKNKGRVKFEPEECAWDFLFIKVVFFQTF